MAEFKQRITLEGADVVLRQLQQIGATGQQSFNQLQTAVNANNTALSRVSQTVNATQQSVQRFGQTLGQLTSLVSPLSNNIGGLLSVFGAFAGPAGIAAASVGLIAFVRNAADTIVQTDRLARAFGLSNAQFRGLGRVVQEAGLSIEDLQTALTRFAGGAATEASRQVKGLVDVIKLLPETNLRNIINVGDVLRDVAATREASRALAEQIKAALEEARDPRAAQSVQQLARQIEQTARRSDDLGAAMRKALDEAGRPAPLTQLERLDQIIVKSEAGIRSLGVSFLDVRGKQVDTLTALSRFIDELAKVEPGLRRARIEATAFGRGIGVEVAEALINARQSGESLIDVLERFGVIDAPVENARQLRLAFVELDRSAASLKNNLVAAFGPDLSAALRGAAAEVIRFRGIIGGNFADIFRDASGLLSRIFTNLPAQLQGFNLARILFNPDLVRAAGQQFVDAVRAFIESARQLFQQLPSELQSVLDKFNELPEGVRAAGRATGEAFADGLRAAFPTITTVIDGVKKLFSGGGGAQGAEAGFVGPLQENAVGPFGTGFVGPLQTLKKDLPTIIKMGQQLGQTLGQGLNQATSGINGAARATGDLGRSLDAIPGKAQRMGSVFIDFCGRMIDAARPLKQMSDAVFADTFDQHGGLEIAGRDFPANKQATDLARLVDAANAAQRSITTLGATIEGLSSANADAAGTTERARASIQRISDAVGLSGAKFSEFKAASDTAAASASEFGDAVASVQVAQLDTSGIENFGNAIEQAVDDASQASVELTANTDTFDSEIQAAANTATTEFGEFGQAIQANIDLMRELVQQVQQLASVDLPSGEGELIGAASGGYIRGPGSGTSDSILARLSNGEFVVRADAVRELMRRYGAGIMWAINRGRLPLPKFSLGGFADRVNESLSALALPRFAGGGMVEAAAAGGGGSQVFLSFNGSKSVGPFSGSEDSIRQLEKAAVSSNMFSAQRRQSSVR